MHNDSIQFVVNVLCIETEVPDVLNNFTIGSYGSRWVSLEWILGFDGNSAILSFRVNITRQSTQESRVLEIEVTTPDTNR